MQYVMAIDPGFSGAVALYDSTAHALTIDDVPVQEGYHDRKGSLHLRKLTEILDRNGTLADVCVVERVAAMPRQGVSSAFRFGYVAGAIDGIAVALGKELVKWTPMQWKATRRPETGRRPRGAQDAGARACHRHLPRAC